METPIKVGIIGVGIMGKAVGRVLARDGRVRLVSVANRGEKGIEESKAEFPFERGYLDYHAMLDSEELDAVFIATPDVAHYEPVMACLGRGIHVHVEKPLTTAESEAAEILREVHRTGLKLQVSYNHRWLAPYHAVKDQIAKGSIGRPLTGFARKNNPITVPTEMLPLWAKDSSPMWFQTSHDIDLMAWWFDDHPVEVYCHGVKGVLREKFGWDTYDAMQGMVKFSKGGVATFEASWIYPKGHPATPDSYMTVVGERGNIQVDRKDETVEMSTEAGFSWPRSFLNYPIFGRWRGAFPACIESFIDVLVGDLQPHVNAYHGWLATATLEALHRSAERGAAAEVATPPCNLEPTPEG